MTIPSSHSFRGLGDLWEAGIAKSFHKGGENYVEPTQSERETLLDTVKFARIGDVEQAREHAELVGFALSRLDVKGQSYLLLEESPDSAKGWGKVLLREGEGSNVVVEVPHPVADQSTPELALQAFEKLEAQAYILAGTHRRNRSDSSTPGKKTSVTDMAHERNSAFQTFHEGLVEPGTHVLQIHGFSADRGHKESPGFPLSRQIVISDGANDGIDPPLLQALKGSLLKQGYDTSIPSFETDADSRLGAVTNAQRDQMEEHGLVASSEFLHVEIETKLRHGDKRDEHFEKLTTAFQSALRGSTV